MSHSEYIAAFPIFRLDGEINCGACNNIIYHGARVKKAPCKHHFHVDCFDLHFEKNERCGKCSESIISYDGCHEGNLGSPCFVGCCNKCYLR